MEIAILGAGLFVFLAHMLEEIFERTRIPDILLLMVLGVLLGPISGVLVVEDLGQVGGFLSVVTLLVILFESGLSLRVGALLSAAGRAVPFSLVSMALAIAALAGCLHTLLELDWTMSLLGGFILGGTSSAVVIPLLKALGASEETTTVLTIESTVTDVFCIIGTVGIAASLAAGEQVAAGGLLGNATFSLLFAGMVGLLAALGWSVVLNLVDRIRDTMFTTLACAMVIYGATETLGASGAIAALAFGITLGNLPRGLSFTVDPGDGSGAMRFNLREVGQVEKKVYAETVFLLKAAFFVYLGMQVSPMAFFSGLGLVALTLAVVPFIPRYPVVLFGLDRDSATQREALLAAVLVPRGLAAAVLAQIPMRMELPGGEILAEVVAMMVFFSIALVSLFVFLIESGKLAPLGALVFRGFSQKSKPTERNEAS